MDPDSSGCPVRCLRLATVPPPLVLHQAEADIRGESIGDG